MVPFRAKTLRDDVILSKNSTKEQLLSASQIHKLIHSHTEWREKFLCYFFVQLRNSCYPRKVVLRRLTSRSVETVPKQSAVFATLTNEGKKIVALRKSRSYVDGRDRVCRARGVGRKEEENSALCKYIEISEISSDFRSLPHILNYATFIGRLRMRALRELF